MNESFARAYFRGRSPLGQHLVFAGTTRQYEIVGMVKDAKYLNLREAFPKTVYFDMGRKRTGTPTLLVHMRSGDPLWIVPQIETMLRTIDPTTHLQGVGTFADHIDRSILDERIMATLGGFFGILALAIACIGVCGVMAFQVVQRTREFGVRLALGETRHGLTILVLREVAAMLLVGGAIGLLAAVSVTRMTRSFLFGVTATDPRVFACAVALLALTSLAAGYVPARRAARVDPMVALRHE